MNRCALNAIIIGFFLITACGGGGSGGGDVPEERPTEETSGYAIDAIIEGGTVNIYNWNGATKGEIVGSSSTDENGFFSVGIKAGSQPILLELVGGQYKDEATERIVRLQDNQKLYSAINHSGSTNTVMITPLTTLSAALAEFYCKNSGFNAEKAINDANVEVSEITGIDITNEYPIDITIDQSRSEILTESHIYGFFCAALSSWASELNIDEPESNNGYTSIYLCQLIYSDVVYDGILNGYGLGENGEEVNLSVGNIALNSQVWRQKIAQHILLATGSAYNRTGLKAADVVDKAYVFSQQVGGVFGDEEPLPLDTDGPVLVLTEPAGKHYRDTTEYGFRLDDLSGIESVSVYLDDVSLPTSMPSGGSKEDIKAQINTSFYSDGDHVLKIVATDFIGNQSSQDVTIYINNSEIYFNATIKSLCSQSDVSVYKYENGIKGELVGQGKTDAAGTLTTQIFTEPRAVLIELSGGTYKETGTSAKVQIQEGQKLTAAAIPQGADLVVNITPLTTVAAAQVPQLSSLYPTTEDAVTAANENLSAIYGVDILSDGIIDISDSNNATSICTNAYRHAFILAGLSLWTLNAAEANGVYGQQYYNSLLLAEKMAADIAYDGALNGGQDFGSVPLNADVYQNGFADAILNVIESGINSTRLNYNGFIGTDIAVADAAEESQVLGSSFSNRADTINREFLSVDYVIANQSDKALFIAVKDIGTNSSCQQDTFDAVRKHVIARHRNLRYRARAMRGNPAGYEEIYYSWQTITKYAMWENQRWNTIVLPITENVNLDHNSDALPPERYQGWEYFITENVGEVKNFALNSCNPRHQIFSASGKLSDPVKYEYLYDYYLEEYVHPNSHNITTDDGRQYLQKAWGYSLQYTGPHHEYNGPASDWWVTEDQFQYLTQSLSLQVTPEIQRDYTETFTTVEAPHNVTSAENTQAYACMSRITVEGEDGGAVPTRMDRYVISPGRSITIKKYINTPNVQLYSGGEINYTPTTFDNSLTWTIDKSLSISIVRGDNADLIGQMPVFEQAFTGNKTYLITR